jgi:hypothetical protein
MMICSGNFSLTTPFSDAIIVPLCHTAQSVHAILKVMQRFKSLVTHPLNTLFVGLLVGALIILAIRFISYNPHHTHYHANFAVYINGTQEQFKSPTYYQEITACQTGDAPILPEQRAHMHDNINSVVHVHDDGVTWGDFFTNLGWYIGPDFIRSLDGNLYKNNDASVVHFILNGDDYTGLKPIAGQVIGDKDRLLVSYGNDDAATLQKQYNSVARTAAKYDANKDPASCGGSEGITVQDRLDNLF